ncbi:hypothetical protein [Aeromonas caviae]|uniref:hypothetical protein n=1 Tax=Aeromonas caviae TaxID=648 RepID=UPI002B49BAE6|nr:hypothetical protein [Aeromonas caviae]
MKKYLFTLLFFSFCSQAGTALNSALKPWSPSSITKKGEVLHISIPQANITDSMYKSIIKMGVCPVVWDGKTAEFDGVKEIALLNQYGKQGYVFENAAEACTEMGKLSGSASDTYLLSVTRLY